MPLSSTYKPAPWFETLGPSFYDEVVPARFPRLALRFRNQRWAARVGLGDLTPAEWEAHFGRFEPLPGNLPKPLALRYHGHQFDVYNPDLGDGRGFLFAQLEEPRRAPARSRHQGQRHDAVVARRRRPAHAQGRRARGARDRDARGARREHVEVAEPLRDGRGAHARRRAVARRARRCSCASSHSHIRFGTFQRLAHRARRRGLERLLVVLDRALLPRAPATGRTACRAFSRAVTRGERGAHCAAGWPPASSTACSTPTT